jgi:hypothetical protein
MFFVYKSPAAPTPAPASMPDPMVPRPMGDLVLSGAADE